MARIRSLLSRTCAAALLVASVAVAQEPAKPAAQPGQTTVRGEVLDMACYMAHEAHGPDHAGCAKRCAKGGQPIGLLAPDGTVYLLYASHQDGAPFEKTKDYAGQEVEISGVAATHGGMKGLEVLGVKPL